MRDRVDEKRKGRRRPQQELSAPWQDGGRAKESGGSA
jgi:hypothetical protein